jgi:ABC-type long-subunit fatty acid transport system fused permease/ATPase subunit
MFVLNFVSDWIIYSILAISVGVFLLSFVASFIARIIPFIPSIDGILVYMRIVAAIVALMASWGIGVKHCDEEWKDRTKELENKLLVAEQKSQKINTEIVTKYVTRTKIIKQKADQHQVYIDREIVKYDSQCKIPEEFVILHNNAAEE